MPTADVSPKLTWPPTKEDLQRLYVDQKLSALKIARVYDLKYASEKTAESTILHHLKKNGITRRDAAANVKKVTEAMVDEWIVRYQRGESLSDIAGVDFSPVTAFNHFRKRGVSLRDKVEAQIKAVMIHEKKAFAGSPKIRAYLAGLARGDFWVGRHGRAIRIRLGTTHPAMAELFRQLFAEYGPIREYAKTAALTEYEWILECDLNQSFEFLLTAKTDVSEYMRDGSLFMSFLAGFFDAEGTLYFHKKGIGGAFELALINTDSELLKEIASELKQRRFVLKLERAKVDKEKAILSGVKNPGDFRLRIVMWRIRDVLRFISEVPVNHPEKVAKVKIALEFHTGPDQNKENRLADWRALVTQIRNDRNAYVSKAKEIYESKLSPEKTAEGKLELMLEKRSN